MDKNRYGEALKEADKLAKKNEEILYEELGLRIRDMQNIGGYERSQKYTAEFAQADAKDMLDMKDLKEVGKRWWSKIEKELISLICDPKNTEMREITSGKTIPQVAASLATAALISAAAPPAWLIVATSILAAKIAETGIDAICETWQESAGKDKF